MTAALEVDGRVEGELYELSMWEARAGGRRSFPSTIPMGGSGRGATDLLFPL